MKINDVEIEDTFAEAFKMRAARVIVTAETREWALIAAQVVTGYATSVIACDAEAGVEAELSPADAPDGRPGFSLLFFGFSPESLGKTLVNRIGQCIMTCPTTACYNGLDSQTTVKVGAQLRFFGDGFQISKKLEGRRYWRIPVMDGEFICEDKFGVQKAIAGGNFLVLGETQAATLAASQAAVEKMSGIRGIIMPFPGGIVRSGSKVGSRYKFLRASTNASFCPTIRRQVGTALPEGVGAVYELIVNGLDVPAIEEAMRVGIRAACQPGIVRISAGNYEGKLGQFPFHLHKILS